MNTWFLRTLVADPDRIGDRHMYSPAKCRTDHVYCSGNAARTRIVYTHPNRGPQGISRGNPLGCWPSPVQGEGCIFNKFQNPGFLCTGNAAKSWIFFTPIDWKGPFLAYRRSGIVRPIVPCTPEGSRIPANAEIDAATCPVLLTGRKPRKSRTPCEFPSPGGRGGRGGGSARFKEILVF